MLTILLLALLVLFFAGAPLFAVMLGAGALGAIGLPRAFDQEFGGLMASMFKLGTDDQATVFATIPLFIYAGYIMASARTADRLVRAANAMLGWMPGGLAIVTILSSAIFTTFTGGSGVTIVALGGLLMPALLKGGYSERFSLGLVTGTGSVGLLFPPALPLFVLGTVYGLNTTLAQKWDWDSQRFAYFAGLGPGLVLIACLSVVAIAVSIIKKVPRQRFVLRELLRSVPPVLPELGMVAGVLIILKFTVDLALAASFAVVYLALLEILVFKDIQWRSLWTISKEAMALSGTIFLVIFTSAVFTNYLVTADVPLKLVAWTKEHIDSQVSFLLMLNVLLLLVGMMMDVFSAILVVLPLLAPTADAYGVNPYHLGVIFLLNLEIGYLTPPVGLNLFIASFKFRKPVVEVTKASLPFIGAMLVALMIVTYVPSVTWVPPPKRLGTASAMVQVMREGLMEARAAKEVALVKEDGSPMLGPDGKQVIKKIADCAAIESENDRDTCRAVFLDVTDCRTKPLPKDKTTAQCELEAIGAWTCSNMEDACIEEPEEEEEAEDEEATE
ncbi:MAG: TRAP transporter large permease [Kofleriaceae bacterium]|nr:TRAP transporter large permease [Kofleriaceae bacterium]MBP9207821.1 TRAP transporter large permease [Kofleriaceae bacterium]